MADDSSAAKLGFQIHSRSISLPSRPKPDSFNLKTLEFPFSDSFNSEKTIQSNVLQLAELYNIVQCCLLESENARKAKNGAIVEEALEVSVGLLDSCGAIRELYSAMKENLQNLQSGLRRKGEDDASVISTYLRLRKKVKKEVRKGIRALKQMENKEQSCLHGKNNMEDHTIMLKRVCVFSISVLGSFLSYVDASSSSKANSRRWTPLISKLMTGSSTAARVDTEMCMNEVECVDFALKSHMKSRKCKVDRKMLEGVHGRIEELESEIHSLQRLLIQHRVVLLNILTP
ncbi:PREDICTED: uncharacterized protein LOC109172498 [Ipomoea nil]|uniref:uncharacterized protein LOC109172498 n=1 Tax=Ipomoea nil TaxID=35883 RepID=UPI000900AB75|nr:PREDICTED: uncharacterized protein LOC109172498 [Ipomoea nil]